MNTIPNVQKYNDRTSFVLKKNLIHIVHKLSNERAGILFKSIFSFVNNEKVKIEDPELLKIFLDIANDIILEWDKYNPKSEKYHWNYQGGITELNHAIRNSTEYKIWRGKVFTRDNYTCKKCSDSGVKLNAHHIKPFANYPNLRMEVSNGITLCELCHKQEHKTPQL